MPHPTPLYDLLRRMATDAALRHRFERDPARTAASFDLDPPQRAVLLARDKRALDLALLAELKLCSTPTPTPTKDA